MKPNTDRYIKIIEFARRWLAKDGMIKTWGENQPARFKKIEQAAWDKYMETEIDE